MKKTNNIRRAATIILTLLTLYACEYSDPIRENIEQAKTSYSLMQWEYGHMADTALQMCSMIENKQLRDSLTGYIKKMSTMVLDDEWAVDYHMEEAITEIELQGWD